MFLKNCQMKTSGTILEMGEAQMPTRCFQVVEIGIDGIWNTMPIFRNVVQ